MVGAVGSGKSSLISAILGELHSVKGFVNLQVAVTRTLSLTRCHSHAVTHTLRNPLRSFTFTFYIHSKSC